MTRWENGPYIHVLIGLEQGSAAEPYEVVITTDTRKWNGRAATRPNDQVWVSCNCPAYTRGAQNKGLMQWQRSCKHIERGGYTVNSPEIDRETGGIDVRVPGTNITRQELDEALRRLPAERRRWFEEVRQIPADLLTPGERRRFGEIAEEAMQAEDERMRLEKLAQVSRSGMVSAEEMGRRMQEFLEQADEDDTASRNGGLELDGDATDEEPRPRRLQGRDYIDALEFD